MNIYVPTYLYIKQHSITGLKYFGKTTRDPIKYLGSGTYWKRHIKKHGKEYVETLWYQLFDDKSLLTDFALLFSEHWDIVNSKKWANLMLENGLDGGGVSGITRSIETKKKMSISQTGRKHSDETKSKMLISNNNRSDEFRARMSVAKSNPSAETRARMSIAKKGKKHSNEHKLKNSVSQKGISKGPQNIVHCPYCVISGGLNMMKRWHFNNCKLKSI